MASMEEDYIEEPSDDDEDISLSEEDDDDDSISLADDSDDEVEVKPVRRRAAKEPEVVVARDALRAKLDQDIQAFLARGGNIQKVDSNVTADPPRKPESNYGQQPL